MVNARHFKMLIEEPQLQGGACHLGQSHVQKQGLCIALCGTLRSFTATTAAHGNTPKQTCFGPRSSNSPESSHGPLSSSPFDSKSRRGTFRTTQSPHS